MSEENNKPAAEETAKEETKAETVKNPITSCKWKELANELGLTKEGYRSLSSETQDLIKQYNSAVKKVNDNVAICNSSTSDVTKRMRYGQIKNAAAIASDLDNRICDSIKLEYKEEQEEQAKPEVKPVAEKEETPAETKVEKKEEKKEEPPVEVRRKRVGFFRLRR